MTELLEDGCAAAAAYLYVCSALWAVKRMYIWSSIGFMIRFLIPQFIGICALVYFWNTDAGREMFFNADGAVSDDAATTMRAMPIFLGQLLPVGVIGVVAAGMIAAFMSTHDTWRRWRSAGRREWTLLALVAT